MKAVRVNQYGDADSMSVEEIARPECKTGEVLVRLQAIGLNFIDVYQRSGLYKGKLPYTVGSEGAGVVDAVGEGVDDFKVGDLVAYTNVPGAYAEYAAVPAAKLVKVPEGIDAKTAAASMLQGMTAHYLCNSTYPVQQGDWCLVHAAAGGVGLLLSQMIAIRGGKVIGTVSTAEKADLASANGVDRVVNYTQEDFVAACKEVSEGKGIAVVYDGVGKDTFLKGFDCLRPRGMMVLFGQSSGPVEPVAPTFLQGKGSLFLTRPSLAQHILTREELNWRAGDVLGWIRDGKLKVRIGQEFPLAEATAAHKALEGRQTTGKTLLIP